MAKRDYYETLGISKGSSDADIKKAFRSKARELHPDKNSGSAKAEEEFKAVNEAYDILKDPNKKAAYDQYGHAAFENGGFGNSGGGADFSWMISIDAPHLYFPKKETMSSGRKLKVCLLCFVVLSAGIGHHKQLPVLFGLFGCADSVPSWVQAKQRCISVQDGVVSQGRQEIC